MSSQKVNVVVPTSTPIISPLARVVRTVLQVIIAVGAAIPVILSTPAVAGNAALVKDLGVVSAAVVLVTTTMNTLEHFGVIPVLGAKILTIPSPVPEFKGPAVPPDRAVA